LRWTEGFPIEYQQFQGKLDVAGQPRSSVAYFRVYWRFLEPERGKYRWDLVDTALRTAHARGQSLMLRVAPYGTEKAEDVPGWYRTMLGDETGKLKARKWMTDPEDPRYVECFGGFVRALAARYDGHPDVELVDVSIVGAWGESAGTELLRESTRDALLAAYFEGFRKTPLVLQLEDNDSYARRFNAGYRFDCLGDNAGGFAPNWGDFPGWSHMHDYYPRMVVQSGLQNAWTTAPVALEACGVMQNWKNSGWSLDYIIDQSLKWHISTFNNKSSAVPAEWQGKVDEWLKRMGYRFVLRSFSYPVAASPQGKLGFWAWWENKGVAPVYKEYTLALKLEGGGRSLVLPTTVDARKWLPGDAVSEDAVFLPAELPEGEYQLSLALVDPVSREPRIRLAIEGRREDGWYPMGKLQVKRGAPDWGGGKFPPP
jgi:hypothetical protein